MSDNTENKKIRLRKCALREIKKLEEIQNDTLTMMLLDKLKNKFNICESAYKVILKEYLHNKKKKESLNIDMRRVPAVFSYAGYDFDKKMLARIFGTSKGKDSHTIKELRNLTTHGMDEKAISEIIDREEELFEYMDDFLLEIKDFDCVKV